MKGIFMTGARPAATYGACVNGFNDHEIERLRSDLLRGFSPCRGASRSMRLSLFGDPACQAILAPALQYVRLLWKASCVHLASASLISVKQLTDLWRDAVPSDQTGGWNESRGPLRRVVLTLGRIGWRVRDAVTWIDDSHRDVRLVDHSPAMMEAMMSEALQRRHEESATAKLHGSQCQERICVDLVKAQLNSKKLGAREKYLTKALACRGLWTRARLKDCGFDTDGLCEHPECRQADTVFHRLWLCRHPPIAKIRDSIADSLLQNVAKASREDPKWTMGVLLQPTYETGLVGPQDCAEGPVFLDVDGAEIDEADWKPDPDHIAAATDGSCFPHVIRGLSRAGWALVFFDPRSGALGVAVFGHVWASLPQTAQAGEHVGLAALYGFLEHQGLTSKVAYVDCKSVANLPSAPLAKQLCHTARYAGVRRSSLVRRHTHLVADVRWTPAHRSEEQIARLEGEDMHIARANAYADELAKRGAKLHPPQSDQIMKDIEREAKACKIVLQLAAKILPLFSVDRFAKVIHAQQDIAASHVSGRDPDAPDHDGPDLPPPDMGAEDEEFPFGLVDLNGDDRECELGRDIVDTSPPIPLDGHSEVDLKIQREQNVGNHCWQARRGSVQCKFCMLSVARWIELDRPVCAGRHPMVTYNFVHGLGHLIQRIDTPSSSVQMCVKCGSWGNRKFCKMRKACPGVPDSRTSRDSLMRVRKGQHPAADRRTREQFGPIVFVSEAGHGLRDAWPGFTGGKDGGCKTHPPSPLIISER